MTALHRDRWRTGLIALAALVLAWRAGALASLLAGLADAPATPAYLFLSGALAAMGASFVVLGLAAFWRSDTPAARLFALYAAFAGMHWGGPLHASSEELQTGITLGYLVLSSVLGQALLLHFTLVFPERWSVSSARPVHLFLYLPVALALLAALVVVASPVSSAVRETSKAIFLATYMAETNLYELLAIVAICLRFFWAGTVERRRAGLGVMLLAIAVPDLLYVTVQIVEAVAPGAIDPAGLGAEPFNLFFVATPIGFAYAIRRLGTRSHAVMPSGCDQRHSPKGGMP